MKRVLFGLACLLAVWTPTAGAEEIRTWDIAGTRVSIEPQAEGGSRATIARDGAAPLTFDAREIRMREPAGENVTGSGVPQLVLTAWSGGDHCCFTTHMVELGPQPRMIQSLDTGPVDVDLFNQFDNDSALEIGLPDISFIGWPGNGAPSPLPRIILHWDGKQYVPSAKLMRAGTMLYQMQERTQPHNEAEAAAAIFKDTLDMIYAGRIRAARILLKQLLPPTPENKRLEQEFFDCKLPSSPWWPFIAGLNNMPAKAPACPS